MRALLEIVTGAEKFRIQNLETKAVRWDNDKLSAYKSASYFINICGAKNVRVENVETGEVTEYHLR